MTLDEFLAQARSDLRYFEEQWRQEHPEAVELHESDWYDQLTISTAARFRKRRGPSDEEE